MASATSSSNKNIRVLVTGASGFVGAHCVQQLLKERYTVRGTVRDVNNLKKVNPLKELENAAELLELVETDLNDDKGWNDAVKDCTYILHVASPFPTVGDESLIKTAVEGTLRVLRAAAQQATVKKVVLTSSIAAIHEGHDDMNRVFTEEDWTNLDSESLMYYPKSKTLAEQAAWDFVNNGKDVKFKLTVINPGLVLGPLLHGNDQGTSIMVIRRFMTHQMPAVPNVEMPLVDVRDVARAHIRSMTEPKSDGQRILLVSQPSFSFMQIANTLRQEFGPQGYYFTRLIVPYPLLWLYSFIDSNSTVLLHRVGQKVRFENTKVKKLLGIDLIDPKQSIIDMAYDIVDHGLAPKRSGYHARQTPNTTTSN